jgi:hypothetical protein
MELGNLQPCGFRGYVLMARSMASAHHKSRRQSGYSFFLPGRRAGAHSEHRRSVRIGAFFEPSSDVRSAWPKLQILAP